VNKPTILAIVEDEADRTVLSRELVGRYAIDYSIVVDRSTDDGLQRLRELAVAGDDVALC
jgi:hypothetical protein